MTEVWKDVKGYEGLYKVSDRGAVKSCNRLVKQSKGGLRPVKEKILKPEEDKDGYLQVFLSKNGKQKMFKVHRLVAAAFVGDADRKLQINHVDGNKKNNSVNNLEWCTVSENAKHRVHTLKKSATGWSPKPVVCVETGERFESVSEAALKTGARQSHISSCLTGMRKTTNNFHWRYCGECVGEVLE